MRAVKQFGKDKASPLKKVMRANAKKARRHRVERYVRSNLVSSVPPKDAV